MPPTCLPETPSFESHAERTVWTALLAQLPDDPLLMANLALTNRSGDLEADLVVV